MIKDLLWSPWSVQRHDYPPLSAARIPHSSKLSSSQALTDSPTLTPLAASGSQFHERCTCGATCQDIGGGRCRYEAGDA